MKIFQFWFLIAFGCSAMGCAFKKDNPDAATYLEDAKPNGSEVAQNSPRAGAGPGGYRSDRGLVNQPVQLPPRVGGSGQISIGQASVNGPFVAMTFDDGPHPSNTPRLLDMLAQRNIKATFFVVGTNTRRYPEIIQRMIAEGHEVANHTVTHASLTKLSDEGVRRELAGCHDAIVSACGVAPRLIRPPYGAVNTRLKNLMHSDFGYTTVMWSVDPRDWQRPGSSVVARRIVDGSRSGSIILAHDIHSPTIDAMPMAFDELLSRGFRFVTVSQLMALQGGGPQMSGPPQIGVAEADGAEAGTIVIPQAGPPRLDEVQPN